MNKIRKAVIPVGGMGTRFLPVTKAVPKEMLPIIDVPTLQYIVEEAVNSGIEEILLINSYGKQSIESYFVDNNYLKEHCKDYNLKLDKIEKIKEKATIYFTYQQEPLGNGQAMMLAERFINGEDFAVLWGDDLIKSKTPVLKQLIDSYNEHPGNIIGVQKVEPGKVSKYGMVKFKDTNTLELETIIEKPKFEDTPSLYAGLGRYIVSAKVFDELRNIHEKNGEFYFTDALANMMSYQSSYACIFDGKYYDIGSQVGYIVANIEFGLDREDIKNDLVRYFRTGKL